MGWPVSDERSGEAEFLSYARNRTVMGHRVLNSREELVALIDGAGAWGWTLDEFRHRAGVRFAGDTAYVTEFLWHEDGVPLDEVWRDVQTRRG